MQGLQKYQIDDHCRALLSDLKMLNENVPDELRSVLPISLPLLALPVPGKFGWLIKYPDVNKFNISKLELFYYLLSSYGYLSSECSYENFKEHFIGNEMPDEKIKWFGKNYVLVLLFDKLLRKEVVAFSGNLYDTIIAHFKDSDGKPLKRDSLERQASRGGSDSEERKIKKIVSFLTC